MKNLTYLRHVVTISAAVAAGLAFGAASDLPQRDSTTFDFKYEMESLPTEEDLDEDGFVDFTMNNSDWLGKTTQGFSVFDCSQSSRYIMSGAAGGEAGGAWQRYGVTAQTGYTIEIRLRVTAETAGTTAAFCLQASVPDSNVHAMLNFKTNMVLWGNTGMTTTLTNMNTSIAFHTYRLVREPGKVTFSVWCDGNLVAENLGTGMNYGTLNRLLVGSIGGAWKGGARVAWLRFTKGGYAPKITEKDSIEFAHRYEMDSTDTRFSPTGDATDWNLLEGAEGTSTLSNGRLCVSQPNGKMRYWRTTAPMDSSITATSPFTLETKVLIKGSWNPSLPVLNFFCGTPRAIGSLVIGANSICWNDMYNPIWRGDNTDKEHVFRIAYDGDTEWGFTIWRDGELIAQNRACYQMTGDFNYARFGIASTSTHGGSFEINYIRWTTDGVFAPFIPPKGTYLLVR